LKFVWFNIFFGLLLAAGTMAAQQSNLLLIDRISEKPVAYAHILVESIDNGTGIAKGYVTDIDGKVTIDIDKPVKIIATFMGYRNLVDTISPGQDLTLLMEPTVFNVDEVVVTAQYKPESVDKSIYKIKVLGPQLIENKAAITLTDLLEGELNIRIQQDNIFGSSIVMQGLSGEHVKFLIDGVPVIGRQDGQIDMNQLNLLNVEHVEVIQGPMSVVYGSNALAGVINIITKESDRQSYSVNAEGYYESIGQYNFALGGSYAKKRHSFSLYGNRNFFDGYNSGETIRFMQWKPKLQYNLDGSYKYQSKKTMLKFSGVFFDEEVRDPGNPLEVFNYNKAFDKYYFTRRWTTRGEYTQTFKKNARLNIITAWSDYRRIRNTYLRDLTNLSETLVPGDEVQDTTTFNNFIFRPIYSNSVFREIVQYQLGLDLNFESGSGSKIENGYQEIGDYAAFLTMEIIPVPQLSIQPGLRVIYNTQYDAPLTYSLNLKWNISEPLSFRISTAKGFRAPSLKELYLDFVDLNHDIRGNPNLEAEVAQNINMNLAYNSQTPAKYNWGIDMGLFYNHIQNKIELVMINPEPLQYSYINVDQFYTHGMELMFNNRVYPWLRLNLGFALTGQRQYVEGAVNNSDDYYYYTDFNVQASYWWQLTDLHFSVFYKYNGSYPQLLLDAEDNVYVSTLDPFNTLDINVGRWFWKRRINVQLGGKNLFDVTNVNTTTTGVSGGGGIHTGGEGSRSVAWGRTWFIKLQFAFNK
jgi:outer membrane receptor for ferrienterochelin and colicins